MSEAKIYAIIQESNEHVYRYGEGWSDNTETNTTILGYVTSLEEAKRQVAQLTKREKETNKRGRGGDFYCFDFEELSLLADS